MPASKVRPRVMRTVMKSRTPWFLVLPDGSDVKDDRGNTKWFRTRAEADEYRRGPIKEVAQ